MLRPAAFFIRLSDSGTCGTVPGRLRRRVRLSPELPRLQTHSQSSGCEKCGLRLPADPPRTHRELCPSTACRFQHVRWPWVLETRPLAPDLGEPATPTPGVSCGRTGRISQLPGKPSATYASARHPGRAANARPLRRRRAVPVFSGSEDPNDASLSGSTHKASVVAVYASCHRCR
jgi:hypothetical protein